MMQELSKFELVCERYGLQKIMDGWKFSSNFGKKRKEKKNKGMKTLDEKYYNQIMDENLPFGWKLKK